MSRGLENFPMPPVGLRHVWAVNLRRQARVLDRQQRPVEARRYREQAELLDPRRRQ